MNKLNIILYFIFKKAIGDVFVKKRIYCNLKVKQSKSLRDAAN